MPILAPIAAAVGSRPAGKRYNLRRPASTVSGSPYNLRPNRQHRAWPASKMPVKWDDATTYLFLQIVLDQKRRYNWSKMGLTKHGWNQVYKEFQAQTGKHWENKALNNKLNALKKSYTNWRKLLNHTGLGRGTDVAVTADDTFWAGDDPESSEVPPRRGHPPEFLDQLEELYGDRNQDKGKLVWAGGFGKAPPATLVTSLLHPCPTT